MLFLLYKKVPFSNTCEQNIILMSWESAKLFVYTHIIASDTMYIKESKVLFVNNMTGT